MEVDSLCSDAFISRPFLQKKNILLAVHGQERKELGMENFGKRERGNDRAYS